MCPVPHLLQVVRLWVHECERVLGDRLVSEADQAKFGEFRAAAIRKFFGDLRLVGTRMMPYCPVPLTVMVCP